MRIAIDLDGVCYEWDRTARYMLREYRSLRHPALYEPSTDWHTIQRAVGKDDWRWLWKEGVRLGLFRYGHMVKGCRIGLQELVGAGHKLEIVTHRPAAAVNDTLDWISLYFKDIPLHGVTILTNQEPKTRVNADVLIDDKPENAMAWYQTERTAILFDRPHNQDHLFHNEGLIRVYGWKDVVDVIEEMRKNDAIRRHRASSATLSLPGHAETGDRGRGEQEGGGLEAAVVEGWLSRGSDLLPPE